MYSVLSITIFICNKTPVSNNHSLFDEYRSRMNELSLRSVVSIDRTTGSFSTIAQEIVVPKEEDTNGRERQTDVQIEREREGERETEKRRRNAFRGVIANFRYSKRG